MDLIFIFTRRASLDVRPTFVRGIASGVAAMYTKRMCSRTLCTLKIGFRNGPLVGRQGVLSLVLSLARFGEEKFEEEAREEKRRFRERGPRRGAFVERASSP